MLNLFYPDFRSDFMRYKVQGYYLIPGLDMLILNELQADMKNKVDLYDYLKLTGMGTKS